MEDIFNTLGMILKPNTDKATEGLQLSHIDINEVVFSSFKSPYLVKDSQIYSIDGKYYNIETGEFYCDTNKSMQSTDYLFLENSYDTDKSKRGVMKINKKDGTWTLYP